LTISEGVRKEIMKSNLNQKGGDLLLFDGSDVMSITARIAARELFEGRRCVIARRAMRRIFLVVTYVL